jgi:hypothetical protein
MSTFSAPGVIDAMVTAFADITDLSVIDGPAPDPGPNDLLQVAVGPQAVQDSPEHEPGLGLAQIERYTVNNRLWSRRGSGTYKERRDAVDAFLGQIKAVLDADKTLGGACMWAQIGRGNWTPLYAGSGKCYMLDFGIDVRARVAVQAVA